MTRTVTRQRPDTIYDGDVTTSVKRDVSRETFSYVKCVHRTTPFCLGHELTVTPPNATGTPNVLADS